MQTNRVIGWVEQGLVPDTVVRRGIRTTSRPAPRQTCERAELVNGMNVLELSCGWGSLMLWMARYYPNSRITAVSNSNSQREFIEAEAHRHNLRNVRVLTCDMNTFDVGERFDRAMSVEMFEHMRNWHTLCASVALAAAMAAASDLKLFHLEDIGPYYATTLRRWRENFSPTSNMCVRSVTPTRSYAWGICT